jgi:branched-chain amino acid aminotransferase
LYRQDKPLVGASNRGLRYGDGLFETMKWSGGRILLEGLHFDRLFQGMDLLGFQLPSHFRPEWLLRQIRELCEENGHSTARIRFQVFRGEGGLFDPENHFPNFVIQSWDLSDAGWTLNNNGLVAGIYEPARKMADRISHLKTTSFLPYVLAALHAKSQQWNEAILLNGAGRVCDSCTANIFLVRGNTILTPPLSEGCISGTMRKWLLEKLSLSRVVREEPQQIEDLLAADEIFLSNSVRGIRWVGSLEGRKFTNGVTTEIFREFFQNNP